MVANDAARLLAQSLEAPQRGQYLRQVGVMVRAATLAELRTRETPVAMVVFALLVLLIFSFAFDLRPGTPPDVLSGVLWSAILFSGMLGLGRGFAAERERGTLDGLLLAVLLGSLAFAVVGTLFAVIAANSRARDVLLPVLLLPVSVPIVIASVEQTAAVLSGPTLLAAFPWTRLTFGYAVLFFIMSMLLFEHVLDE